MTDAEKIALIKKKARSLKWKHYSGHTTLTNYNVVAFFRDAEANIDPNNPYVCAHCGKTLTQKTTVKVRVNGFARLVTSHCKRYDLLPEYERTEILFSADKTAVGDASRCS